MTTWEVAGQFARVFATGVVCAAAGCFVGGMLGYCVRLLIDLVR